MHRIWIALGALAGIFGVGMMAVATHEFGLRLAPAASGLVHTAVQMQMWHALALLLCGIRTERGGRGHWAAACFALGILGFCGGLYLRALGLPRLPGLVPLGGILLMLGWLLLALSALNKR